MYDRTEEEEKKHRDFVILCRDVRMIIAKEPGISKKDIAAKFGSTKIDGALGYMFTMDLVRIEFSINEEGKRVRKWFVVPQ